MTHKPPADGSPATAVLTDGPAAGQTIDTHIGHLLPPLHLTVDVPHLDERPGVEALAWVPTRYARSALYRTRHDPAEPWEYFHHPAPGEPALP